MLRGELDGGFLRRGLYGPQQVVALMQIAWIGGWLSGMHRRHFRARGREIANQPVDVGGGKVGARAGDGHRCMCVVG